MTLTPEGFPQTKAEIRHAIADELLEVEEVRNDYYTIREYTGRRQSLFAPDFNDKMFQIVLLASQNKVNGYLDLIDGFDYQTKLNGRHVTHRLEHWDGFTPRPGVHKWYVDGIPSPLELHTGMIIDQLRSESAELT